MEGFFQPKGRPKAPKGGGTGSTTAVIAQKKSLPWVEKYRPKSVDDVAYQDEVVSVLKKCVEGGDFPNLLFYGPPGTGKTSAILAVSRELFGIDMMKSRVLELNASDDRGIQVIREKVKTFAQHAVSSTKPDGSPCPPFKIVILDEADSMTNSAQAALRRTMEKQSKTTRFCLICNYISRIIEPLTSRCTKFRFKPLSLDSMIRRMKYVCEQENVKTTDKTLSTIIQASEGDLRKAITFLQSGHQLKGGEEVTEEDILEIAGIIPSNCIESLLTVCKSNSYDQLQEAVKNVLLDGYSASQTITQIHDIVVKHLELNDNQKSAICERIGLIDRRLTEGGDEFLQLLDLCCVIMVQFCQQQQGDL